MKKGVYLIEINILYACMKLSNNKNILNREYLVGKEIIKLQIT